MRLSVVVTTRNKSVAVKTLHCLLRINILAIQNNVQVEITFVKDDPFEKTTVLMKKLKDSERVLFIDYSVFIDEKSLAMTIKPLDQGQHCMVFPAVNEGIDWSMFKQKVREGVDEPIEQMGLHFDTEVGKKLYDDVYSVTKTTPRAWFMDCKPIVKAIREKKGEGIKLPAKVSELFEKFLAKGVKVCAYTEANVVLTYSHECLGNILNAAGVSHS